MNKKYFLILLLLVIPFFNGTDKNFPVITNITYTDIDYYTVKIKWNTNIPSDSKVRYMKSDSNYQAINYTDSVYNSSLDTVHSVTLSLLDPHTLYNFNVTSSNNNNSTTSIYKMFATRAASESTIKVYFNKSVDTTVSTGLSAFGNTDFENILLTRLGGTGFYLDVAVNRFDDAGPLVSSILKLKRDGVVIRFICDAQTNSQWIDTLISKGVKVVRRKNDGHHLNMNFWIFDSRCTCSGGEIYVWSSTGQISYQDFYENKNSAVLIKDRTVAYIYTREFDEMWGSYTDYPDTSRAKFGYLKTDNIPHIAILNGIYTEFYFSPSDSVEANINNFLNTSNSKIFFGANNFQSASIYNKLYSLKNSREIKGIFDYQNSGNGYYNLMKNWADVWRDSTSGKFSQNYFLTDANLNLPTSSVLTGSYKWTSESNLYNDEDLIIFHNQSVTNQYYQEFHQRYKDVSGHLVNVVSVSNEIPNGFKLEQNYPNPFNPATKIKFSIPNNVDQRSTNNVNLTIYNVMGREIQTLINKNLSAGTYEITFDAGSLTSGIYFYRLTTNNYSETKRMLMLK